jgi:RNA polymerase sigma-70 factor, ECF subfamily
VVDQTSKAEEFESQRPRLQAVAYRMLGSVTEAEDAVQEAWLRLSRANGEVIDNLNGWLTTVVGRVCIDMLRARRARREEYVGTWLPEPIVNEDEQLDPEHETLLADSVGVALLVVLETLSPAERLAFVLHDMFGVPFDEIGPMVERSPEAARQLASRARRRVRGAAPTPDADMNRQRELVEAFLDAARGGDFEALLATLDPDVVMRADPGPVIHHAPVHVQGAREVARFTAARGPIFAPGCRVVLVNGTPGWLVERDGSTRGVTAVTVVNGRIATIDVILNPEKLQALQVG